MLRNKQIAIISACSLYNIGLRHVLNEYFSAQKVDVYNDIDYFFASSPEIYDFYFVTSDFFLSYCDFFLPRKNKAILLVKDIFRGQSISNFEFKINIFADTNEIIEQLQSFFKSACQRLSDEYHVNLTPREIEVLQLIAQGFINKEIADRLNISFNTVLTHRKNITAKLGIKTVSGLSFYAMMNGYVKINMNE